MPTTPNTADALSTLPETCEFRRWRVFNGGVHRDEYYSPAEVAEIADNFRQLAGLVKPQMGIGHDRKKRLQTSLGLPSSGTVTGVDCDDRGNLWLDITNIPTWLGGMTNAGRYTSGSVELKTDFRDPRNATRTMPGSVLDGIALLGEEQPAVKGVNRPVAVFADGTHVPPHHGAIPVHPDLLASLDAESEAFSAARCFSADTPTPVSRMDPKLKDALIAAGVSPEQIAQAEAAGAAAPAAPAMGAPAAPNTLSDAATNPNPGMMSSFADTCKKYADDPAATPEQKAMAAMFSEMEDMKKQFADVQAAQTEAKKKDEAAQMAAFSAEVDAECKKIADRVAPVIVDSVIKPTALGLLTAKTFSSETDRRKAFSDYFAGFTALPVDPKLKGATTIARTGNTPVSELRTQMVRPGGILAREYPETVKQLRKAATV